MERYPNAFERMGLSVPELSVIREAIDRTNYSREGALGILHDPSAAQCLCNHIYGPKHNFTMLHWTILRQVTQITLWYGHMWYLPRDMEIPTKRQLAITNQQEDTEMPSANTKAAKAEAKAAKAAETAETKAAKAAKAAETKAAKPAKRTRADITHEMLNRKSGVTVVELTEAYKKEFDGNGKENTARLALSKVPKERGYKTEKTESEKRGVIFKVAA